MVSQASEETSPQSSGLSARVTGRITTPVRWPRARWLRILGVALLVGVYCALWNVVARFPIDRNDLDAFFVPAARIVLSGHPFDAYSLLYLDLYPNANGPLSLAPLTVATAVASWQGVLADMTLRRVVMMTLFAPFVLLMAREAVVAIDRLRGERLRGWARLIVYAVFALSPEVWHSMLFYGHVEQPIMLWLALWGIRQLVARRPARAGLLLGLALLTRSSALLLALPLAALLARDRDWRALWRFGAALVGTMAAVLLPFAIADGRDLLYSLVTFHGRLPVGGGSFWGLTLGTPLEAFARQYDSATVLVVAALLSVIVVLWRRDLTLASPALYLLLALSSLCFPLLLKTLWPYYFLEPFTFLAIGWFAAAPSLGDRLRVWLRWGLALLLPAMTVGFAAMREVGITMDQTRGESRSLTLALTIMLALTMATILWLLLARFPSRRKSTAPPLAYADTTS